MKKFDSRHMIKYQDLNHNNNFYAGRGADWVMEASYVAASNLCGEKVRFFYKNTHKLDFLKPIKLGDVINFQSIVVRVGKKSLTVRVNLLDEKTGELKADGYVTYVTMSDDGTNPIEHGLFLDEAKGEDEKNWRQEAESFFK